MLKPVTKRYRDDSTMKQLRFTFYCDCCGKPIPTAPMDFENGFSKKVFLTDEEREVRAILYADDHRYAYERANNEARLELNRCEICGEVVCEDCTVYEGAENVAVCCRTCLQKAAVSGKRTEVF